ncbi:MAG TPA: zinc-ribbon domain-containing protein [Anaeromyxobacteraceae bacterium]|nr:zinc-ribbon domain-containing protein [Anaeromyxobacteraceae bacterium]
MIVTCTSCQSRFRVADEKIGPRGVKVRCSKCQTVFPVRREPEGDSPPAPAPGLPLPAASPPPLPPRGASVDLDLETGPAPPAREPFGSPAPDPFAPRADDPFAPKADDPFAAKADDPFAAASDAGASPRSPLGGPGLADPWVASVVPGGAEGVGPPGLPLTDLSDLAGGHAAPDAAPAAASQEPASLFGDMEGDGLALEDRTTPPPLPRQGRSDLFGGFEFQGGGAGADPGESPFGKLDLGGDSGEPVPDLAGPDPAGPDLALAASGGRAALFELASAPALAEPPAPRPSPPRPAAPPPQPEVDVSERVRRRRGAAIRSVAVNAVSLAVLLLAALALAVILRGDAPLEARSLRPAALLGALGRVEAAPVVASELTNGLFERARGAPLLFVRGQVLSRSTGDLPAVHVRVEVVRDGAVVAEGDAMAGALPTPEELWAADDEAALGALRASLRARAARPVRPGQPVPFLVAIADYPVDLSGASLRVTAAPEDAAARRSP